MPWRPPPEEIWTYEMENGVNTSPAVSGGTVVFGNEGVVYGLDAASGDEKWTLETGGTVASPTVADGTVVVGSDQVYALDVESGDQQWSADVVGSTVPAVDDGTVYVGSDESMYALDAQNGEDKWSHTPEAGVRAPVVGDGKVFYESSDGSMYAVDAESGEEQWDLYTGDYLRASPAVVDDVVYLATNRSDGGDLYALDAASGEREWEREVENGSGSTSSPAIVDDTLVIYDSGGNVVARDVDGGEELWSFDAGYAAGSSPAVVNGTVFIGSGDGSLYAITE